MIFVLCTASPLTSSKLQAQSVRSRNHKPHGTSEFPKLRPPSIRGGGEAEPSNLESPFTLGVRPGFPEDSGNAPRVLGRDAPARARGPAPCFPLTRRAGCARRSPFYGGCRPRGSGWNRRFKGGRGRGFPSGRAATSRSLPHRLLPPRAKIKPADPPAGESGTGESSACRSRRVPPRREPRRAHLRPPPSPPCLKRSELPTGEGMATPPKRSCPSPSASSEGTRIKKISIEGNIGKGPREMLVPKQR